ncbi:acid protease [Byssothecium circinans]|uniref:Acid protease n=1 Tax=Byssothecium circinans TaxID=147558 RepID=A0A6A5UHF7_9PLEO|nr:acid protease [Byssothecium circinans]
MHIVPRGTSSPTPQPYVVPPSQEFDGNDGSWSTFKVNVGGQDLRVQASTKSGETYVIVPAGCVAGVDPSNCASSRGAGILNSAQSPGFQSNTSSTWSTIGQYDIGLEQNLGYEGRGMFGYDTVTLGSETAGTSLSLKKQVVAGVAELDYFMGHIPLGTTDSSFCGSCKPEKTFLWQLRNNSMIPSLSFAYTAGAKYRSKSYLAQLILGGYDTSRFLHNTMDFSFSFSINPSRLLSVAVNSITATNTLKGTYSLSSSAHFSLVDSTVPHIWLPRDICDAFETAFGLTYDSKTDLYLVNTTIRSQLQALNPSITFKLANTLSDTTSNYTNIILPYSAFDLQASYPYYPNATNYFPIRRAANDSQYTLGRTLLQEAYLIVDYERANFTITRASFPEQQLPAAKILPIHPPSSSSHSNTRLSVTAIAGIIIGSTAVIAIIASAIYFFLHRRRKQTREDLAYMNKGSCLSTTSSSDIQELDGPQVHEMMVPTSWSELPTHDQKIELAVLPTELPIRLEYAEMDGRG